MKLKKILNNIKFNNVIWSSDEELMKIREMRNEEDIRTNMKTSQIIQINEHLNWFKKMKSSKINYFYSIKYEDQIVGGLGLNNYNKNLLFGEWSYYVSKKSNFIGLGASIEFKAIEYFFNFYKLKYLFCYVLRHNLAVIKLHNKFGFQEISFNEYLKNENLKNKVSNAIYLVLKKSKWDLINKKINKKYFV